MAIPEGKTKISFNIDKNLLDKIDMDIKEKGMRRSDWIIVACKWYLMREEGKTMSNIEKT